MRKFKKIMIIFMILMSLVPAATAFAGTKLPEITSYATGFPGQQVDYSILISNTDGSSHTYSLAIANLPKEYQPVFFKEDKVLPNNFTLASGENARVELKIALPQNVSQAKAILFQAVVTREDNTKTELRLSLFISNSSNLVISNESFDLKVLSGKQIEFPINITNMGQKDLTGISLLFDTPYKWTASSTPDILAKLEPGKSYSFKVKVLVPPSQDATNQTIKVVAKSVQIETVAFVIPVIVQKSGSYLLFPAAAVLVVLISVLVYFKKRGRR